MGKIFLCYRRSDSSGHTGRIFDHLARVWSEEDVFYDQESLHVGNWRKKIDEALAQTGVMLVVMGDQWLKVAGEDGRRRLLDPEDHVRYEVRRALESGVVVIPVLVESATESVQLVTSELPPDLATLPDQQTCELRDRHWDEDIEELTRRIRLAMASRPGSPLTIRRKLASAITGVVLLVMVSFIAIRLMGARDEPSVPVPVVPESSIDSSDLDSADTVIDRLQLVGIGYSVNRSALRDWLAIPNGEYLWLARACLQIIGDRMVRVYVDMDVIVDNYREAVGVRDSSQLPVGQPVDDNLLRQAILKAYVSKTGTQVDRFEDILR